MASLGQDELNYITINKLNHDNRTIINKLQVFGWKGFDLLQENLFRSLNHFIEHKFDIISTEEDTAWLEKKKEKNIAYYLMYSHLSVKFMWNLSNS